MKNADFDRMIRNRIRHERFSLSSKTANRLLHTLTSPSQEQAPIASYSSHQGHVPVLAFACAVLACMIFFLPQWTSRPDQTYPPTSQDNGDLGNGFFTFTPIVTIVPTPTEGPTATATVIAPSPTPTETSTVSPISEPTNTPDNSPTSELEATPMPSPTPFSGETATILPTVTPVPTRTPTPTPTPFATPRVTIAPK